MIDKLKRKVELSCNNVAIFCDYDNIYYGLTDYGLDITDYKYDVFQLMNEIYGNNKIRTMKAFADFDQIHIPQILKHLQSNRVEICNVFGTRKNASDIMLSIDAIEMYYNHPKIDTFVFITSDSDMISVMNKLLFYGKQIHLYYIEPNANEFLPQFCNIANDLISLMNINIERKNSEYWIPIIKNIFNNYQETSKYDNPYMKHKWLIEHIQKEIHMSYSSATRLIRDLLEMEILEKSEVNNIISYALKKREF